MNPSSPESQGTDSNMTEAVQQMMLEQFAIRIENLTFYSYFTSIEN